MALRPEATPAVRASRWAEVQRSVHAGVSLQYHLTSLHALPPSGNIWLCCRWIPHIQHATTAGRRAATPAAEGARCSSAMIASPPGGRRDPGSGPKVTNSQPSPRLARQPLAGMLTRGWPRRPTIRYARPDHTGGDGDADPRYRGGRGSATPSSPGIIGFVLLSLEDGDCECGR